MSDYPPYPPCLRPTCLPSIPPDPGCPVWPPAGGRPEAGAGNTRPWAAAFARGHGAGQSGCGGASAGDDADFWGRGALLTCAGRSAVRGHHRRLSVSGVCRSGDPHRPQDGDRLVVVAAAMCSPLVELNDRDPVPSGAELPSEAEHRIVTMLSIK